MFNKIVTGKELSFLGRMLLVIVLPITLSLMSFGKLLLNMDFNSFIIFAISVAICWATLTMVWGAKLQMGYTDEEIEELVILGEIKKREED